MKQNNIVKSIAIAGVALLSSGQANAEGGTVVSAPAVAPTLEVYQKGLMATVFSEEAQSGTWASSSPVGIPIGEFVDQKIPKFTFANLKQEPAAWSLFSGAHIGIQWNGYFHAEEPGDYVIMIEAQKKRGKYYYANSCNMDLKLSDSSVVNNSFKWRAEDTYLGVNYNHHDIKFNKISLESGYYPLSIWLHCGVTKGEWDSWVSNIESMSWTVKLKRPSDRIVQVVPDGLFVWK